MYLFTKRNPLPSSEAIEGSGLTRAAGKRVTVLEDIPKEGEGKVRMDRREWTAASLLAMPFKQGSRVEVSQVRDDGVLLVKRVKPGA